ncbi:putative ABC transport system permease protein [Pedococcus dokdonensis]|uniref:Putative ABC transport system permease protein n=1 Tax=Pedococcus dokdonensis TaxID=443156 RepID=A0A1H0M1R0_9MICO|nr:ABC transporter permease [Pedococcus dokdonensis]SDO74231.1 putative ABC transport system permease protein [Pedococcus dokdonensis]
MTRHQLTLGSLRELGTVGLVAALCGAYAATLITTSTILTAMSSTEDGGAAAGVFLSVVAGVFILIALYVGAVVIVNAVDTVVSGRLRHIALLRLLGASGRDLRTSVMRGTPSVGVTGAGLGLVVGTGLTHLVRAVLVARGTLPRADYPWFSGQLLVALAAISVAATAAGWLGSRVVLGVSPATALAGTMADRPPRRRASVLRAAVGAIGIVGGLVVLGLGALLGESNPGAGFVVAFFGAAGSGTGFLIGARFVIPRVVAAASRLLGRDPASLVARRNAVLDPLRTTRSTMGLVVGVALVTTFASGTSALQHSVAAWELDPARRAEASQMLAVTSTVMICIIVISSVIAAVGFVSTMSLTVIQRHREIGLLRSLGFTQRQVRTMITKESVALSASAVAFGILLGLVYGSLGAQSLVGSQSPGIVWGLPVTALVAIAASGVVLVLVASRRPARRAVAVAPVEALRIEG